MAIVNRLQHAWNAFMNRDPTIGFNGYGSSYSYRPDRPMLSHGNERSIITSVINRIAMDCAAISIEHVKLDNNNRVIDKVNDGINNCLTLEANIDQTGREFIQDAVMSMLDEGVVALAPIDVSVNPNETNCFDIETIRTAKIEEWRPDSVKLYAYNEQKGKKEHVYALKRKIAIVQNPLYAVMNEPNSTMQRLVHKLNLLDVIDEQSGSGKLDLIIQLPYQAKTELARQRADNRRADIEKQLVDSKYGIAYIDATEKVTQLNRSVDNNLMKQIEYLTSMLYSQLGITTSIMDGTADANTMNNYYSRTIEPIMSALVDEMKRKFLTKTARSQGHLIEYFRDPFKLIPVNEIPDIADKLTRNEILTSNEVRQIIGYKPASDPGADELRNKNLSQAKTTVNKNLQSEIENNDKEEN